MPPKGRRTDAARAREIQARGLALARKADFLNIVVVLRGRPDIVSDLKQRFINDAILLPTGEIDPNYKAPDLAIKQEKIEEDASSSSNPAADAADAEIGAHTLHRKFTSWAHVPPRFLKWLLSAQEPISLSKFSMKAITTQGAKEPNKETMLELLEFMSDIPKDMTLGDLRQLSDLKDFLGKRNIANGRRCHSLRLPVEWGASGFYLISMASPGAELITITERFTNISVETEICREPGTFPTIEMNYSKKRASLAYTSAGGTFEKIPIIGIFITAGHVALFSSAAGASPAKLAKREAPDSDPLSTPAKRTKREPSPPPLSAPAVPGDSFAELASAPAQTPPARAQGSLVPKVEPSGDSAQQAPLPADRTSAPPCATGSAGDPLSERHHTPSAITKDEPEAFDEACFVPPPGALIT